MLECTWLTICNCCCYLQSNMMMSNLVAGGRGDFDNRPAPKMGPSREAELGSIARPFQNLMLESASASAASVETNFGRFTEPLKV